MENDIIELTRQRISEALFLIGLGVVWVYDAWWPGLVMAFGLSWSASQFIQKRYWSASVVATLLCVVPAVYFAMRPWDAPIPLLIIGLGAVGLARALYLRR